MVDLDLGEEMKHTYTLILGLTTLMSAHGVGLASQRDRDPDDYMANWQMPLMTDGQFEDKVIAGQNLEIKLGHLAEERGSDTFTTSFGKMLVHDHSHALDQLQLIHNTRRSYGLTADHLRNFHQNLTADDQQIYDRLASMSGPSFDEAFRRQMMESHKMSLKMFKMEAAHATDQELRQYAENCVPVVKKHLQALKDRSMPM